MSIEKSLLLPEINTGDESQCADLTAGNIAKLNALFANLKAMMFVRLSCQTSHDRFPRRNVTAAM